MSRSRCPLVLGIASSHNGGACLMRGDEIVVAIQEERLLRQKRADHPGGKASLSIRYCLDAAGITPAQLDLVVVCACRTMNSRSEDPAVNPLLRHGAHRPETCTIPHHFGHAVGAFATSGFDDAVILVVDGCGSPWSNIAGDERAAAGARQAQRFALHDAEKVREIISFYRAAGTAVTPCWKQCAEEPPPRAGMPRFWSLGSMYESAGWQIFGSEAGSLYDGAGKVMGLAAYGDPDIPPERFFCADEGEVRFPDDVPRRFPTRDPWPARPREHANLAASVQLALEEALLFLVRRLRRETGGERLCYAGGVALNSVANERIIREGGFKDVFIMPAAEDSGTAIGAACYGVWTLTGVNTHRRVRHDAVGREYGSTEIDRAIDAVPAIRRLPARPVVEEAVTLICEGKIVGWFQGRSELGPRALGQRSIVCDPRPPGMKDHVNSRVKFREPFRPFAPAVLLEHTRDWFEIADGPAESPFMLRVMPFRHDRKCLVPALVHADGTGRVQTLTREANGLFYELVRRFHARSGVPMLLNTSFNVAGEPIVETPTDALWCLLLTGLDACVIGDRLVGKAEGFRSILDLVVGLAVREWSMTLTERHKTRGATASACARSVRMKSFHSDREEDIEAVMGDHPDWVRIAVDTPWGPVVHLTTRETVTVLRHIDGGTRGWELLDRMQKESDGSCSEAALVQSLASLRRGGIVTFRAG